MNEIFLQPGEKPTLPQGWQLKPYPGSATGLNQYTCNTIARVSRGDQVRRLCVDARPPINGGKERDVALVVLRGDHMPVLTGERTRAIKCATGDEARAVRELLLEAPEL